MRGDNNLNNRNNNQEQQREFLPTLPTQQNIEPPRVARQQAEPPDTSAEKPGLDPYLASLLNQPQQPVPILSSNNNDDYYKNLYYSTLANRPPVTPQTPIENPLWTWLRFQKELADIYSGARNRQDGFVRTTNGDRLMNTAGAGSRAASRPGTPSSTVGEGPLYPGRTSTKPSFL